MSVETKSILYDATPSWNGFNYQGKVGLYVCLTNILQQTKDRRIQSSEFTSYLNTHSIEYEWLEDFSIKENEKYISLHQVKHKEGKLITSHIDAIHTIMNRKKGILPETDLFNYFDFSTIKKTSTKRSDIIKNTKKEILQHLKKYKILDNDNKPTKDWKIIIESTPYQYNNEIENCLTDFEHLNKNAFSCSKIYFHTSEPVSKPKSTITNVKNFPQIFNYELLGKYSLEDIGIFLSYDNQNNYTLALTDRELDATLHELISSLLKLINPKKEIINESINLHKIALISLISDHISKRHINIRRKTNNGGARLSIYKECISFDTLFNMLKNDFQELNSNYWNLICRENFETAYNEHLKETEDWIVHLESKQDEQDQIELNYTYLEMLKKTRHKLIDAYFPDQCSLLMESISLHEIHDGDNRQYYEAISNKDKIKGIFLQFIQSINKDVSGLSITSHNNDKLFHSSCIDLNGANPKQRFTKEKKAQNGLTKNHIKNRILLKNVDYIVAALPCNKEIPTMLEKITEVEDYDVKNIYHSNKIEKFTEQKKINFINIEKAIGIINE